MFQNSLKRDLRLPPRYVTDRAWFVRLYGEIIPSFSEGIIDRTGAQTMLNLGTMIPSVDLAHYGVSRAKDLVSVDGSTSWNKNRTNIACQI